jgi:hypothetical protein
LTHVPGGTGMLGPGAFTLPATRNGTNVATTISERIAYFNFMGRMLLIKFNQILESKQKLVENRAGKLRAFN